MVKLFFGYVFWMILGCCVSFVVDANELKNHPSPYLALHGNDPVNWNDWHIDVVEKARTENKLLFLSVGYFSCHWCHVMQQESYQDPNIAEYINANYIPVKIDRELEPALDARLIEFTQKTEQRAGWPLNVFITPEGYPLFSVLYLPPQNFQEVLERVYTLWKSDGERLKFLASKVNDVHIPDADNQLDSVMAKRMEDVFIGQVRSFHDEFEGGFGSQNKFPNVPALLYLLDIAERKNTTEIDGIITLTLDAMAQNGLFDHVGGGFFRYSVDPSWNIPHFEKMLYDNSDMARLYWLADRLYPNRGYKQIAERTFDFMSREMLTAQGALVASFSAVDDQDIEGGYYLWHETELEQILGKEDAKLLMEHCQVYGSPVLESGHHLRCFRDPGQASSDLGLSIAEGLSRVTDALLTLRQWRTDHRVLPVDSKLLAGWNGLALSAFSAASGNDGHSRFRSTADGIQNYIINNLWKNNKLYRAVDGDTPIGSASIEDYAQVARGLWDYASVTENEADYGIAREVFQRGWSLYRHENGWKRSEKTLLAESPPKELFTDSPLVSPASIFAQLAIDIGLYFQDEAFFEDARQVLSRGWGDLSQNAFFYGSHIRAQNHLVRKAGN